MWFDEAVIYQIYPLGLCGAPAENDGVQAHRILRILDWVDHIKGVTPSFATCTRDRKAPESQTIPGPSCF